MTELWGVPRHATRALGHMLCFFSRGLHSAEGSGRPKQLIAIEGQLDRVLKGVLSSES